MTHAPSDLAIGEGRVWVELAGEGRVAGVDPASNTVATTTELGVAPGGGRVPSAAGRSRPVVAAGQVWARLGDRVVMIDATTGAVRGSTPRIPVGDGSDVSGATITDRGDVWFGDWRRQVVIQLPRHGTAAPASAVGGCARDARPPCPNSSAPPAPSPPGS